MRRGEGQGHVRLVADDHQTRRRAAPATAGRAALVLGREPVRRRPGEREGLRPALDEGRAEGRRVVAAGKQRDARRAVVLGHRRHDHDVHVAQRVEAGIVEELAHVAVGAGPERAGA